MKKFLSRLLKGNFKTIFKSLLESHLENLSIKKLAIELEKNCLLGKKKDKIYLIPDEIVTPYVLKNACWDYEIIQFIKRKIKNNNNIFMDIGANVGLITKQLLTSNIKIKKFLCFEPDKNAFECLEKNLAKKNNVSSYNFGLGLKRKNLKLYKNQMNSGDNSFIRKNKIYEICKINNINFFLKKNYKIINNNCLIYKSDTQGMDEELFIGIQDKYFEKIKIAIIEITNHKFIKENNKKFFLRIKLFNKIYDKKLNKISINQISNKIKNKEEFDLLMSR
jgi:FkbM family methyltransferase